MTDFPWTSHGFPTSFHHGTSTTTAAKMQKLCTKGRGEVAPMAKDPQVVRVVTPYLADKLPE